MYRVFNTPNELINTLPKGTTIPGRPVRGWGSKDSNLIVVKAHPVVEDLTHRPFRGCGDSVIRTALLDFKDIRPYFTFAFPFYLKEGKVTAKLAKTVPQPITTELEAFPGVPVLFLGASAAAWTPAFTHEFRTLKSVRGKTFEINGRRYRVTGIPSSIAYSPSEFNMFVKDVHLLVNGTLPADATYDSYHAIETREETLKILNSIPELTRVACDVETNGLDPLQCKLLTIQLSWEEGSGYAFKWSNLLPEEWEEYLLKWKLIFQNGSFDTKVLAVHGVDVRITEDTMLMHSLVDETSGTHSLEAMSRNYLNLDKWEEMVDYSNMELEEFQTMGVYGARDTDLTLQLANHFRPLVRHRAINGIIHDTQNVLIDAELRGIKVDQDKAEQFLREIEEHLSTTLGILQDGYNLQNPNSPKQVADMLLANGVFLPKNDRGNYVTDEATLTRYDTFPAVNTILEYRHLVKAKSTYLERILNESAMDGRYHPEFKLAATETGRLVEPLLLVLPRPDDLDMPDLGKQYQVKLRELFVPDEGMLMFGADYSALEISTLAYLSNDAQLIDDLVKGLDIHSVVAIQAFGLDIPLEPFNTLKHRVQKHHALERTMAKGAVFSSSYGGGTGAVMRATGATKEVANQILHALATRYPQVEEWKRNIILEAKEVGSVTNVFGRTRRFVWHRALGQKEIAAQEREAINFPNQSTATDLNLVAFLKLAQHKLEVMFPFHDAVYLQAPEDRQEETERQMKLIMESIMSGPVPFRVDVGSGRNWGEV